jgi:cyanate permease
MKGPYHDYMPDWYLDVGLKIVQAMVINSVMPYVGVCVAFIVPRLIQGMDNSFTGDHYKTRQTSLIKYRMLYSGKDYEIHFKYSDAIVVVYITMMYGLGMPILFPIAAFTLFNQWLCERIVVAWSVK